MPRLIGLVGVAIVILAAAPWRGVSPQVAAPQGDRTDPTRALIAAWSRSQRATFVGTEVYQRFGESGAAISTTTRIVQRPPDRLTIAGHSVSGALGGRTVGCGDETGTMLCAADRAVDVGHSEAAELDELRRAVAGADALYAVTVDARDRRCFGLRRTHDRLVPPYGDRSRFCFDERTGVMVQREVSVAGIREVSKVTVLGVTVSDGDLDIAQIEKSGAADSSAVPSRRK